MYEDHFKIITQFKQSLLMKLEAETVLLAIREKATNGITGGHMAQLMKDIADN